MPEASTASAHARTDFSLNASISGELAAATGSSTVLAGEEQRESQQRAIPARADPQRAGAALRHLDRHGVLELERRRAVAIGREPDLQEAGLAAERDPEAVGPIALEDVAAGIALQLEVAAARRSPLIGMNQRAIRDGSVSADQVSSGVAA